MTIRSYNSFEEMQADMARAEEEAQANVTDVQRTIAPGDYWMRPAPEYGFTIYGRAQTEEDLRRGYPAALDIDEAAELDAELEQFHSNVERNYLMSEAFSVACPHGEFGSVHRSVMWPISAEQFADARDRGWDPSGEWVVNKLIEMIEAHQ